MADTLLTEKEALTVSAALPELTPDEQQIAKKRLADYWMANEKAGLPLFPNQQRKQLEGWERVEALYLEGEGSWTGKKPWADEVDFLSFRRAAALSQMFSADGVTVASNPTPYRAAIAQEAGRPELVTDDAAFDTYLQQRFSVGRSERELLAGEGGLFEQVTRAAHGDEGFHVVYSGWLSDVQGKPGYSRAETERYQALSKKMFLEERRRGDAARLRANEMLLAFDAEDDDSMREVLESMIGLHPSDVALTWRALEKAAGERGGDKGPAQKLIETIGRSLDRVLVGAGAAMLQPAFTDPFKAGDEVPQSIAEDPEMILERRFRQRQTELGSGLGPLGGRAADFLFPSGEGPLVPLTPDQAEAANEERRRWLERGTLQHQFTQAKQGVLDPIRRDWWGAHVIYGGAEVATSMATYMLPYGIGIAGNAMAFQYEAEQNLVAQGASRDAARSASMGIALGQAALDRAQLGLFRRVPGVKKILDGIAKQPLSAGTLGLLGRAGGIVAFETGIEVVQDPVTPAVMQDIWAALERDVPDVDWQSVRKEAWAQVDEVALSMLVPALIGAVGGGDGSVRVSDEELRALGYNERQRESIAMAQGGVRGSFPEVTAEALQQHLSPELGAHAQDFIDAGARYGLDPRFLAAIARLETANGSSRAFREGNNAMGISDATGPLAMESVRDSIFQQAASLARPGGHYEGANTISEIGAIYAPPGAGNDPHGTNAGWADLVGQFYEEMGGESATADDLLAQEWLRRGPSDRSAVQEIRDQIAFAPELAEALNRSAGVSRLVRDNDGWRVELEEGGVFEVDSAQAARVLVDELRQATSAAEAEALADISDWLQESATESDIESVAFTGETATADEGGAVTYTKNGQITRILEDERSIAEMRRELDLLARHDAGRDGESIVALVAGQNEVTMRQQIADDVEDGLRLETEVFQGGGVLGLLHERVEARFRAGLLRGFWTEGDAVRILRKIEDATGLEFLKEESSTGIREAVSDVVVADAVSRRKDGSKLPGGAISTALDAMIRTAARPDEARALGKFRAFMRAARAYFREVFRAGAALKRARREGRLQEGDEASSFINELLGVDAQARHNQAVVDEAIEIYRPPTSEEEDAGIAFSIVGGYSFDGHAERLARNGTPLVRASKLEAGQRVVYDGRAKTINRIREVEPRIYNQRGVALFDTLEPKIAVRFEGDSGEIFLDPERRVPLLSAKNESISPEAEAAALQIFKAGPGQLRFSVRRADLQRLGHIQGYRAASRYLLPEERAKLKANSAKAFVEHLTKLPSKEELAAVAKAGKAKRGWYKKSADAILSLFGYDAPRFAALLAAMSPQTSVESNLRNALNTWANWLEAGRPSEKEAIIDVMAASVEGSRGRESVLDAWINNTVRALSADEVSVGSIVISGPKVNSFMLNLLGVTQEVTLDAWMANYALVDQKIFGGSLSANQKDPGKGTGYLAFASRVRAAADYLTKTTGETWTPAEVQETVWSWAKALYELQERKGETRGAVALLDEGELTDDLIAGTPDFSSLLLDPEFRQIILPYYGEELEELAREVDAEGDGRAREDRQQGAESEADASDESARERRHQRRAAKRLEELRRRRLLEAKGFSIRSSDYLSSVASRLVGLSGPPSERVDAFERARARLADLATATAFNDSAAEGLTKRSIEEEKARRIAQGIDEASAEIWKRYPILNDEEQATLRGQPVFEFLATSGSGIPRLNIIAPGRARKLSAGRLHGDYDGAMSLPSWIWGGGASGFWPDQAAQEAFDAGIIAAPTPDALWQGIGQAIDRTSSKKDQLANAKMELKAAHRKARLEADAWANKQLGTLRQRARSSAQRELEMGIRTLDAILVGLPPEVRGKVGGFSTMAALRTNEQREKYLLARVTTAERELERYLVREYREGIENLLKRSEAKRAAGEKPTGNLGAEGHRYFDAVQRVVTMTEAEQDAERQRIQAELGAVMQSNASPAEQTRAAVDAFEREQILDQWGGALVNEAGQPLRDAAALAVALQNGQDVFTLHRNRWRRVEELRLEEMQRLRSEIVQTLGSSTARRKIKQLRKRGGPLARAVDLGLNFTSWVQTLEAGLGQGHPLVRRFNEATARAQAQKTDAMILMNHRLEAAMRAAMGGDATRLQALQRLFDLSHDATMDIPQKVGSGPSGRRVAAQKRVPVETAMRALESATVAQSLGFTPGELGQLRAMLDDKANRSRKFLEIRGPLEDGRLETLQLTPMEAITISMLRAQEQYRDLMEAWGYDRETDEAIEEQLPDDAKAMRRFFNEQYRDGWEPLNRVFARMYGVDLPQIKNYAPGNFEHMGADRDIDAFGEGIMPQGGMRMGMVKQRKPHTAEPRILSALSVYSSHVNSTEHFMAFAELTRELRSVWTHPEVKSSIKAAFGDELASKVGEWIEVMEQNGKSGGRTDELERKIRRVQGRMAKVALAGKLGTLLVQGTAAMASSSMIGQRAYWSGFARLVAGQGHFREFFHSDVIQRRVLAGASPAQRVAMSRIFDERPSHMTVAIDWMMELIGRVDGFFSAISGSIAFDHHFRRLRRLGMSEAQARTEAMREAADVVRRTAQPVELTDRSLMELNPSAAAKFFMMFASESRKNMSLVLEPLRSAAARGGGAAAVQAIWKDHRFRQGFMFTHILAGAMAHVIRSIWWDARDADDGDDDETFLEEHILSMALLRAMAIAPLEGLPFVRDAVSGFSGPGPLGDTGYLMRTWRSTLKKMAKGELEFVDVQRSMTVMVNALGRFHSAATLAAVPANVFDQIYDVYRNAAQEN